MTPTMVRMLLCTLPPMSPSASSHSGSLDIFRLVLSEAQTSIPWLAKFEFLRNHLDPVLVGEPGVLDTLGHETSHVCEDGEHEGDPDNAEQEAEHPAPEGRSGEVSVTWDCVEEFLCDGVNSCLLS